MIFRRCLREIPPWISLRDPRVPAWLTPKRGNLRGVATPDLATWGPDISKEYLPADVPEATGIADKDYGDISDEEMDDWPDSGGDSSDYSPEEPTLNQPDILAIDTQHGVGHTKLGTCPCATCPHTCYILNKNINGLGGRSDNKLEKLISMMIARKIHAYCVQETWQLHKYMLTIRGYTVFHHGMDEKPQRLGRMSARVMIILGPDLNQAWTQAGKLEPITSSPTSQFPGRMIGVTLSFLNFSNRPSNTYHRRAKGSIKLFLCSVHHPCDSD